MKFRDISETPLRLAHEIHLTPDEIVQVLLGERVAVPSQLVVLRLDAEYSTAAQAVLHAIQARQCQRCGLITVESAGELLVHHELANLLVCSDCFDFLCRAKGGF